MIVRLYRNFTKKDKSTKIPTGDYSEFDVAWKEDTSILEPVIKLAGSLDPEYNYVHIPEWGRYYFITDIETINNNIFNLHCSCDFGASNKVVIGNTSAYILRSASASDGSIVDTMYPTNNDVSVVETKINNFYPTTPSGGTYVLGVVGDNKETLKHGTVSYYGCTENDLKQICSYLFSEDIWQNIKNDYEKPLDYIVSCYWVPGSVSSGKATTIKFGRFTLEDYSVWSISSRYIDVSLSGSIQIPKHPQAGARGKYLNNSPYSSYAFYSPVCGNIPLPAHKMVDASDLTILVTCDVITGQGRVEIATGNPAYMLANENVQMAVNVTLSQNAISIGSIAGTTAAVAGAVGSAFVGNVPGAITGTIGAIGTSESLVGNVRTQGSNGSFLSLEDNHKLISTFMDVVDEDNTHFGRPLCQRRLIKSLSGYVLCKDAIVDMARTLQDKQEVESMLNTGFYYE